MGGSGRSRGGAGRGGKGAYSLRRAGLADGHGADLDLVGDTLGVAPDSRSNRRARAGGVAKGTEPVRMTDSVQNLLLDLRLKSENTEEAPSPPILRVCVPGVESAASGDGTCRRSEERRTETIRNRRNDQI
jgi:hypothetical protein